MEFTNLSKDLKFRLLNSKDLDLIFNFNSSIENLAYVPRAPFKLIEEAEKHLAKMLKSMEDKTAFWWIFVDAKTSKSVGYGGLFEIDMENHKAEIGYGFLKEFWGKGYASSIVDYITNFGYNELKLHRIFGLVDPENKASKRVLEKSGYLNEGVMHDFFYARGRYFDMFMMVKLSTN